MVNSAYDFWQNAWQLVLRAQHDTKHEYRTPVIATVDKNGIPRARTVVLRKANASKYELFFYTDSRSEKFVHLGHQTVFGAKDSPQDQRGLEKELPRLQSSQSQKEEQYPSATLPNPHVNWLFWSPRKNIQLSAGGPTRLLPEKETSAIFNQLPKHSRKTYATLLPPGTAIDEATNGLPANWDELELAQTDYARTNFRVIVTSLQFVDVLQLGRSDNRRAKAIRLATGDWEANWVVP